MSRIVSLALLVCGAALILIGVNATYSFRSDVSSFFTGSPTDKPVLIFIGGAVVAVIGLASMFHIWKKA